MTHHKTLKILIAEATCPTDQRDAPDSDLWSLIDQVRHSQDPSIKARLHHLGDDTSRKGGEADTILVLTPFAAYAVRHILRFIVDLIRDIGLRRKRKIRVKTKIGEILYEGEHIEELKSLISYTIEQLLDETSDSSALGDVRDADIEIIIEDMEDSLDESS